MQDTPLYSPLNNDPVYAIGYVRVSDRSQETDGNSLESQEKAIRRFAASKGWILIEVVHEVFSGYYLRERKELAKVRERVRTKEVQVVIVNSLDRLSREAIHQAVLLNEMIEHKVTLESVTEQIDQTPLGNFLRQALAFAAAIEREKIIERSSRGIQNKMEKGQMIGTGMPKYGYEWGDEKHTHYIINPMEAAIISKIYHMYVYEGMSIRGIAAYLHETGIPTARNKGVWGTTTVTRILSNEFYKGEAVNHRVKWEWVDGKKKYTKHPNPIPLPEGTVPAIVTPELWSLAAEKRAIAKQDAARRNPEPHSALLRSGFVVCGYCGHVMTVVRYNRAYPDGGGRKNPPPSYRCSVASVRAWQGCNKKPSMAVERLDSIVWEFVRDLLGEHELLHSVFHDYQSSAQADISSIDSLIKKIEEEQERIILDLRGLTGRARELMITDLNRLENDLTSLQEERLKTVPSVKHAEQIQEEVNAFLDWCEKFKGHFDDATYEEKRRALRYLGVQVKVFQKDDTTNEQYKITVKPELMERLFKSFCDPTCSQITTL
ncbi:MAG TPA: recombinase family protein [Ktedonobacteraceae bacterium]|jgi:site-specific DNA recombinase